MFKTTFQYEPYFQIACKVRGHFFSNSCYFTLFVCSLALKLLSKSG